jgi:acyl carrier protein
MRAARVRAVVSAYVEDRLLASLNEDANLSDLKVDPLDRLGIACALDEEFLIEIPDEDEEGWKTVGDVLETIQRLGTERPAVSC